MMCTSLYVHSEKSSLVRKKRSHSDILPAIDNAVIRDRSMIAISVDQDRNEIVGPLVEDVRIDIVVRFSSSMYDLDVDVTIERACSTILSNTWVVYNVNNCRSFRKQ
jgi:hypothetical protein